MTILLLAGVGLILVMLAVTVKGTLWLTGRTVTLPTTTANASCKPRCKEPAIFSGKTEDFKEWMFTLQEAIAILQPQDPVGYAASFMEGSARQWVMALWQDNGRSSTWQQFQKQMCDAFAFEHQEEYERQRLVRTRQTGGLEDYIHTFSSRCLAARSMDDLTKTILFTEGLVDGEVAREVQRFHPRTLSEAIRAARTAAQSKRSGDCATGSGELRRMIGQPVPKPRRDWKNSSRQRMSEAERERLFREGRCFRCKEIGHLASKCSVSVRYPNVNRQ